MSEDATSAGLQQGDSTSKPLPVRKVKSTKSCNVCGRGFIKLAHLIRHVRTHGDERPFSCSKCDKAFARTDALQRHERAVHAANDSREVDEMEMPAEQGLGDGKEAANPDRIPRKRKRSSAGGERGGPQPSGSETGSTPRGQVDENSIFHPDFSHLFGLDHLQAGQKAHGQQQPPSASAPLATTSNSVTEQTSSGDAVSSALGVPDFTFSQGLLNFGNMPSVVPQSVPIASYMASFPPAYPSVPTSLDASIDSWLTLEGGPHAAENALEMVFSGELLAPSNQVQHTSGKWDNFAVDQQAQHSIATTAFSATSASMPAPLNFSTPSANNGPADNGFNKLYPFGLQFEDLWKASPPSNTCTFETAGMHTSAGESSKESHQVEASLMSNLPVSMTAKSTEDLVERHSTTAFAGTSRGLPSATSPPTISSHTSAARDSDMDTISPRPRPKRKVVHRGLTTDTWLNTMQASEEGNIDLPRPDITSPEQIIGELAVETSVDKIARRHWVKEEQTAIPSMKFLDSCLHLYFRDFHPTFPILHKPTFSRHQSPPLLLLSMCSIGCIFMGTQSAREKGLWIYERLHHVIVFSRDSRMATEDARVAMTLSGLLGQCFSFLYGEPKHMFTAESFHGCLCTFARRAGLFKLIDQNAITYENVADLDEEALEARWQEWARREMLRRVALGLTLHAADAATYSLLPRLVPVQLSVSDHSSDALFEAEDASSWKWLLLCLNGGSPHNSLRTPPATGFQVIPTADTLFPMSVMAQKIVNILQMKELCRSEASFVSSFNDIGLFYRDMLQLGARFGITHEPHKETRPTSHSRGSSSQPQILKVMWHYCCLARLARLDHIEEVAGREGIPQAHVLEQVKTWVSTPEARLATLHCAHVLHNAADLRDLAFIVPRAIFQSTLVLLCFIAFNETLAGPVEVFDATDATDWEHFAEVVAECSKPGARTRPEPGNCPNPGFEFVIDGRPRLAETWLRSNSCRWKLEKFIEGKEKQMDYVSLLSTTTRLLRRCTPWKIGDAMGDILATINLGY